jgi:hypothetical protein
MSTADEPMSRPRHFLDAALVNFRSRPWTWLHGASLVAAALFLLWAARSQWFFYDDWDFLVSRSEWALLAPHNGHLSLAPALIITLLKLVFGLGSYWPFLVVTLVIHLANAHILWRLMIRARVNGAVAVLLAFTFAVLGAGAENSLWAFQTGFITPLLAGSIAFLLADRGALSRARLIGISALLAVALSFASTAIPIVIALVLYLWWRHGFMTALAAGSPPGILYAVWYVAVARGSSGGAAIGPSELIEIAARVPEYITHQFVDGLAAVIPFAQLAPTLVVLIAAWVLFGLRRGLRALTVPHFLVLAALVFSVLIGLTRVQLGVDSAVAGRYVYVLFFLLAPIVGVGISAVVGNSRLVLTAVALLMVVTAIYNVALFTANANGQASLEHTTKLDVMAAYDLAKTGQFDDDATPLPVIAPQLRLGDILDFVDRGQLPLSPPDDSALLSTQANLELVAVRSGDGASCEPEIRVDRVVLESTERRVYSTVEQTVSVVVQRGEVRTQFVQITIDQGSSTINGLSGLRLELTPAVAGSLCSIG